MFGRKPRPELAAATRLQELIAKTMVEIGRLDVWLDLPNRTEAITRAVTAVVWTAAERTYAAAPPSGLDHRTVMNEVRAQVCWELLGGTKPDPQDARYVSCWETLHLDAISAAPLAARRLGGEQISGFGSELASAFWSGRYAASAGRELSPAERAHLETPLATAFIRAVGAVAA